MRAPRPTVLPDRISIRLCASRPEINQVQDHAKTSELQAAAEKKKRVSLAIPKMDPSPHQASSWSAVPGGLQGAVGLDSPHGTPKSGKKVLTLWLVRVSDPEDNSVLTRRISEFPNEKAFHRMVSHKRSLFTRARRYSYSGGRQNYQRHQWLVVDRVFLEFVEAFVLAVRSNMSSYALSFRILTSCMGEAHTTTINNQVRGRLGVVVTALCAGVA